MKKKIILLLLASLVISSYPSDVIAAEDKTGFLKDVTGEEDVLPNADIFNVDFVRGTTDISPLENGQGKEVGSPVLAKSTELNKNIASFDGKSAYTYSFTSDKYKKITENVTMECMVKFNRIPAEGERDIFSNQEYSGIGLGVNNGMLTFFAHIDGEYREAVTAIRANQWYHIVGVVSGTKVKLYVNGNLCSTVEAQNPGIAYPSQSGAQNMVLGGDSKSYEATENMAEADMSYAKIYSNALSDSQIFLLNKNVFDGTNIQTEDIADLGLIASNATSEEGAWNLNLHASDNVLDNVERIEYDVIYDSSFLEFEEVQHLKDGAEITKIQEGKLHIVVYGNTLSKDDFKNYTSTRIGKLNFKTKTVAQTTETAVQIQNFKSYCKNQEILDNADTNFEKKLTIIKKNALDLNQDGVIGAGDVALAGDELKSTVAENAAIYPYKHVLILTMDGAGTAWNPDFMYYTSDPWQTPEKHTDSETMSKRVNPYAMKLINEEFATSYTAQSVIPAISAQNYFSILHGVPWMEVPKEYQLDNDVASNYYFPDLGLEEANYPSVFQVVDQIFPERQNAAFSEWPAIINGIIEPDTQVAGQASEAKQSFYDVADYIKSSQFKNTAVVYMQNDEMDHIGHGQGYYTDTFWNGLKQYDEQYKAVMDALNESGQSDETLVITNADHGGHRWEHGSEESYDRDVFIGVRGQTVNSGTRLNGGSNADISPIALAGLRIAKPESMTGHVFDKNMFLTQEEMSKKNREIEKITFASGKNHSTLSLENPKSQTRVIDAVIDLQGTEVDTVTTESGTILRQDIVEGKLKLTIFYHEQPKQLAEITYHSHGKTQPVLEEIMLGTKTGKEIYPDIQNKKDETGSDTWDEAAKNSLCLAITMSEKLEHQQLENNCFTKESWKAVAEALNAARALMRQDEITPEEASKAFLNLITTCNLLENGALKTGLKAAIEGTQEILSDEEVLEKYEKAGVEMVREALVAAQNVYNAEGMDQEAINTATSNLLNAVTSMMVTEYDTRLGILIQKAEELLKNKEQYTSSSIQNLKDALKNAKTVAEDTQASDKEINEAYTLLAKSMTSLVRKANKEELKNALDKAHKILEESGRYLESSISGLKRATDGAQLVYENEEADSSTVGETLKTLIIEILKARLMGDVDLNGSVDTQDSAKLLKNNAELVILTEEQNLAGDVNKDGTADSSDAAEILQYAAEIISTF